MMTAPALFAVPKVRHGFFTRQGGHSSGLYESLNCGLGSGDDQDAVLKNRAKCARALDVEPDCLMTVHQEHTANVETVRGPWAESPPVADAMVTNEPGLAIAVLTADCTPVLLADKNAGVIGVAHAGWKGALHGIVENTVKAMTQLGSHPQHIVAVIGPCISSDSYEVGPEFRERFLEADQDTAKFFGPSPKPGHAHFDLGNFVLERARAAGVGHIERIAADTYAEAKQFFSYRRSCHNNEPDYGRQLSGIALGR